MRNLAKDELFALLHGCAVLGTGGGGSPEAGVSLLEQAIAEGYSVRLAQLKELPPDALTVCPYLCGSVGPDGIGEGVSLSERRSVALEATLAVERYLGNRVEAIVPTELGGENTAIALLVAALRDVPVVDGDPAGRSVPELEQTTYHVRKLPITPVGFATPAGDVLVLAQSASDQSAEKMVRRIAADDRNMVGVADHPLPVKRLSGSLLTGTLSKALELGRIVCEGSSPEQDTASEIARSTDGYLLFHGLVKHSEWAIRDGFTIGHTRVDGLAEHDTHEYRIEFKNENIIGWYDEQPDVMAPDLISVLDAKSGRAVTNPNVIVGMHVAVLGWRADPIWRSPRGLAVLGPLHFGLDVEYRPIEENLRLASESARCGQTGQAIPKGKER